ncbi:ArsR/SmtB family transcription factor [Mangrovicella endophytica]|uniref:ArsR/SmtB family transcription factor n=1 Tax=Mangrovicella endophytica TaxID=2066697 RepID=UPI000C9DC370|nr:metalloregulator ArsR/SmtB family transcription factor [Mangrovicella endophytica]
MDIREASDVKFAALADRTRRAILARLAMGEATVAELNKPFQISQPAISKHLRVLEEAGLIESVKLGQSRPRRLRPQALTELTDWLNGLQKLWSDSFDRLETFLASETPSPKKED